MELDRTSISKNTAIEIGRNFKNETLYNYKGQLGWNPTTAYYITNERQEILKTATERLDSTAIYMVNKHEIDDENFTKMQRIEVRDEKFEVYLGRVKRRRND